MKVIESWYAQINEYVVWIDLELRNAIIMLDSSKLSTTQGTTHFNQVTVISEKQLFSRYILLGMKIYINILRYNCKGYDF